MADKPDPNYQPGDVKTVFNPNTGISSNFYGGVGRADGPGHGHTDVNEAGQITYHRDPAPPNK